jgi:molybdate transport system substrate-binding protein
MMRSCSSQAVKRMDRRDFGRARAWLAWLLGAVVLLCVLGEAGVESAWAGEVTIAAAADLNFAFKEIMEAFEKTTGSHVKLSLGSSGNFFSQIQHGAPFDLYFSADVRYPQKLIESNHAVAGSLYRYAIGRIVVWVPNGSPLGIEGRGMDALLDPAIRKIAIANPKHAPYGRAAVAAMRHFRVYDRVKDKLVFGENVSQAAQFVASGAADVGIVALSLALAPPMKAAGRHWEVPATAHETIEQGAVVLKTAKNPDGARAFLTFVRGAEARQIMTRYGFVLPERTAAP